MQPRKPLHLRALRLVGFHNFHDQLIPVRGDLFAVGVNESGKTTILDALHLVLTGGQKMDLNAAASVVGAREGGRTLQGIILRASMTGEARKQGGITYAAAEFAETESDRPPHTLVFGMSVNDMQGQVKRWGFLCRHHAADLPLTEAAADGKRRIIDGHELAEALGDRVYWRMTEYRAAVAELLLHDAQAFDLVSEMWRKAKSYRELARSTRDTAAVIREVLPAPEQRAFENVAKSLADIAEWEVHLNELREDVDALARLDDLLHAARDARETCRRYHYIQASHRRTELQERVEQLGAKLNEQQRQHATFDRQRVACAQEIESFERTIGQYRASQGIQLLDRINSLNSQLRESNGRLASRNKLLKELHDVIESLDRQQSERRRSLEQRLSRAKNTFEQAEVELREESDLVTHLSIAAELIPLNPDTPFDGDALSAAVEGFASANRARRDDLADRDRALYTEHEQLTALRDQQQLGLARLRRHDDLVPELPGLDLALAALAERKIPYRLLYQSLEFADGVDEAEGAAIEAALALHRLSTIIVAPDVVQQIRALIDEQKQGLRVLDARPAPVISRHINNVAARLLDRLTIDNDRCRAHLEQVVGDSIVLFDTPPEGLPLTWWTLDGRAGEPGARWAGAWARPQWIGAARRRAVRESQLVGLQEQLRATEQRLREIEEARQRLQSDQRRLREVMQAVEEPKLTLLQHDHQSFHATQSTLARERERAAQVEAERDSEQKQLDRERRELATLQEQAKDEGTDLLFKEIQRLTAEVQQLRAQEKTLIASVATTRAEIDTIANELQSAEVANQSAQVDLTEQSNRLLDVLDGVEFGDLHRYAFTDKRGAQIKLDNLPKLIEESQRHEGETLADLRGSDGVMSERLARRYSFRVQDHDGQLAVLDPRGQTLSPLAEQRQDEFQRANDTLGHKTQELFERVLGTELIDQLRQDLNGLRQRRRELNRVLEPLVFGHSRFALHETVTPESNRFVELVEAAALTNAAARDEFIGYIRERKDQFGAEGQVPAFLDYRNWFNFSLRLKHVTDEHASAVGSEDMVRGSGGAQGTHLYLLLFALAALLFNRAGVRLRLLMLDEAFYGVDPERKELLLRCGKQLDLQFAIATPDLDGTITEDGGDSTTVLVEKDEHDEVEVVPFVWEQQQAQQQLFASPRPEAIIAGTYDEPK